MQDSKLKKAESGRSMVEMLGVLAIIGVLSVGGISGYTLAMNKHRANQLLNEATRRAYAIYTQMALGRDIDKDEWSNSNDLDGGTFSEFKQDITAGKSALVVTDVPEGVCNNLRNRSDSNILEVQKYENNALAGELSEQDCADQAALAFIFDNNLTSDSSTTGPSNPDTSSATEDATLYTYTCADNHVASEGEFTDCWCKTAADSYLPNSGDYPSLNDAMDALCLPQDTLRYYCSGNYTLNAYDKNGSQQNSIPCNCTSGAEGFYDDVREAQSALCGPINYYCSFNNDYNGNWGLYTTDIGYPTLVTGCQCSIGVSGSYAVLEDAMDALCTAEYGMYYCYNEQTLLRVGTDGYSTFVTDSGCFCTVTGYHTYFNDEYAMASMCPAWFYCKMDYPYSPGIYSIGNSNYYPDVGCLCASQGGSFRTVWEAQSALCYPNNSSSSGLFYQCVPNGDVIQYTKDGSQGQTIENCNCYPESGFYGSIADAQSDLCNN